MKASGGVLLIDDSVASARRPMNSSVGGLISISYDASQECFHPPARSVRSCEDDRTFDGTSILRRRALVEVDVASSGTIQRLRS